MPVATYGRVRLTFTAGPLAGQEWNVRSEVKINGVGGAVTVTANANASMSRSFEPKPVSVDCTFERPREALSQTAYLAEHDIIIEEVDLGRTHFLSAAVMEGEVDANSKSGDLSGIKFACAFKDYRPS